VKVVAIGIGSVIFGIELLRDVFRVPELRGAELWLVDVAAEPLARMTALTQRLNEAADWDVSIHATTDREEALPGADFVVTAVAIDRIATWRIDHELAARHGFGSVLSENGGPGGLSHTLRSIPLMLDIARDVERLAPDAWMLNYTNPENRICLALERHAAVRMIGLCHSAAEAIVRGARALGRTQAEVDAHAVGLNHYTWFVQFRDARDGSDLLPDVHRWALGPDSPVGPVGRLLLEHVGVLPAIDDNHIGEYLPWAAELVGTEGYDFDRHDQRSRDDIAALEAWGSGDRSVQPLLDELSHEAQVDHSSAGIMGDVIAGRTRRRPSFILPNRGYIDNLPADAAVEVPGLIVDGVPQGVPIGPLPEPVAALLRHELAIQEAAIEAAIQGSRDLAMRALLLDPTVGSARTAERFLDDILAAHRRYLPRFWAD
jgi:alpha-galactosidase/6-phospho-beta-glucosidase family protein